MSIEKVSARLAGDDSREVTVEYDFGSNLAEAIEKFGENVVFNRFKAAAVIDLQSGIRRHIKAKVEDAEGNETAEDKYTDAQIQDWASNWKPGEKNINRKSKIDKVKDLYKGMSEEDRQALLDQLMSGDADGEEEQE